MDNLKIAKNIKRERTFRSLLLDKNFWLVDQGYDDNLDLLQEYLDDLFNSVKGNCYLAEYFESQSRTRLIIRCQVCNKTLSSYDPFTSHDKGKSHKKAVQQSLSSDNPNSNIIGVVEFKSFKDTAKIFEPGTLEDMLSKTSQIVIGYQFIYAEIFHDEKVFTCQLCDKKGDCNKMNKNKAFYHITSEDHIVYFMQIKFGYAKESYEEMYSEIKLAEEMEGKIQSNIIAFRRSDPLEDQRIKIPIVRSRHESSSSHRSNRQELPRSKTANSMPSTSQKPVTPPRAVAPVKASSTSSSVEDLTTTIVKNAACMTDPAPPQTMIEFVKDLHQLQKRMSSWWLIFIEERNYTARANFVCRALYQILPFYRVFPGPELPTMLKEDIEAQDLLIQLVKVLAQKIHLFSLEKDQSLMESAEKLLEKTKGFQLPL